jgi:diaminohydroxyphosphoribosylaminopyrimidine deaminase/5-amino-6-(5-phosphoribosylamino)uracil reductase
VAREDAAHLNRPFFTVMQKGRPFVTVKVALSLDARVGIAGERTALSGDASNRVVHRERAEVDAIAVGSGTILIDDPLLTARGVYRSRPLVRLIFDTRLRTPPTAKVLSTLDRGPVIIVTTASSVSAFKDAAAALQAAGARLQVQETIGAERPRIAAALATAAAEGVTSLIIEGGPQLHRAAWDEHVVDRVEMFIAPRALGAGGVPWVPVDTLAVAQFATLRAEPLGDDVLIEGHVHRAG